MKLNLSEIPKLKGEDAKVRFKEIYRLLTRTRWPIYMVGPSGSGKTLMAMNIAKYYSKKHNVPAYYVQLSPDQTKTSLILGLRLEEGSLVPKKGIVAEAMDKGGIIVVDEAPHAPQELLLMFNSICDRTSVTAIGDESVEAKDSFRVIFCGNTSGYAANNKLPQSFAQRMITFNFDYPNAEDEAKIAYRMYKEETGDNSVPKCVANYVTGIFRDVRNEKFPLSVRNTAAALILMSVIDKNEDKVELNQIIDECVGQQNSESVLAKVYENIYNKKCQNITSVSTDENVRKLLKFIYSIGYNRFVESILSASMYYLDVDGFDFDTEEIKDNLRAKLL